ncbi:hypothetical protein ACFT5B_14520 [Luteimicrobium sp. NPDC057192]|uniref:hypothetical protein n=1 Tax=Luteimicrobium sp. NPDC057192 TaxID=3346042 RepID=UPI0036347B6F
MSTTDEKLREAGAAWRDHVDTEPRPALSHARPPASDRGGRRRLVRRRLLGAALPVAAVAVIVGALVALDNPLDGGWTRGSNASCVGPMIAVDGKPVDSSLADPAPQAKVVRQGQSLRVTGAYFVTDCYDTGQRGDPPPYGTVTLTLTAGAHATRLAAVHPDHDGSFTTTVRIPADFPTGPAMLSTDASATRDVDLVVTRVAVPGPQSSSSTNR